MKDFVATSGRLRFDKGVTQRRFTVKVLDDRRGERTESVLLTLTRPSRRALLGTPNVAVLRIKDNEALNDHPWRSGRPSPWCSPTGIPNWW